MQAFSQTNNSHFRNQKIQLCQFFLHFNCVFQFLLFAPIPLCVALTPELQHYLVFKSHARKKRKYQIIRAYLIKQARLTLIPTLYLFKINNVLSYCISYKITYIHLTILFKYKHFILCTLVKVSVNLESVCTSAKLCGGS